MGRIDIKPMEKHDGKSEAQKHNRLDEPNSECSKPTRKKTATKATAAELNAILESQQFCCALSGLPLTPNDAALDHIVAVSDGGTHMADNLQWLNTDVNRMKGSMSQSRFIAIVKLIAENT